NRFQHAILWNGNIATDLGALLRPDQASASVATGINDAGQVVLVGVGHGEFAFLWDGATVYDLDDLLPPSAVSAGWILGTAEAINNQGAIVGAAGYAPLRSGHAYVLTPLRQKEQCQNGGW